MVSELRETLQLALDWALPGSCLGCGVLLPRQDQLRANNETLQQLLGLVCPVCAARTRKISTLCPCQKSAIHGWGNSPEATQTQSHSCQLCSAFESFPKSVLFAFDFTYPFDQVIHRFKYSKAYYLGESLAQLLLLERKAAIKCMIAAEKLEAIIPMPLTPWRRFTRGYNQSTLLATELSKQLGLPIVEHGLQRKHFKTPQAKIEETQERYENVRNAFSAKPEHWMNAKRFLLVDDVITSGATIAAATNALHQAGAETVCALTVCSASKEYGREYLFSERCAEELSLAEN
ncbi:MAG: ComF family protein [Sumerlaeia bacterium]